MSHPDNNSSMTAEDSRTDELRHRLDQVQGRIAEASRAAGRSEEPQLIVVTKFYPADDVRRLAELGVRDVGESRAQEASRKAAELADLPLRWHFIGQVQTNKAKNVARYAHAVHSVDRPQLVDALAKAVEREQGEAGRPALECFVQVNLDDDADGQRGGAVPADVGMLAERIEAAASLRLSGVMAVAPLGGDPDAAFEKLAGIAARLQASYPHAAGVSAGMSQDLEAAVRFGATHLRIGSDILGSRPALG
jgi:pyridoxal phosphate enzyme (YggS family)